MRYTVGIDIGSTTTKGTLLESDRNIMAKSLQSSGGDFLKASQHVLDEILHSAGMVREDIDSIVVTGYGRNKAPFADKRRTEIACHACGVHHFFTGVLTVVDIGGQDNKVIHVTESGDVVDFAMNRKCAAGTGAFLEDVALKLGLELDKLNSIAQEAEEEIVIGSFCTVFAATEMIKLALEGKSVGTIARGAFRSIAKRIVEMGVISNTVVLTGGVAAHNPIIAEILHEEIGQEIRICPEAQFAGAIGAALFGS